MRKHFSLIQLILLLRLANRIVVRRVSRHMQGVLFRQLVTDDVVGAGQDPVTNKQGQDNKGGRHANGKVQDMLRRLIVGGAHLGLEEGVTVQLRSRCKGSKWTQRGHCRTILRRD